MEIKKTDIGNLTASITITITPDNYLPVIEKQLKEKKQNAIIPGFRLGKVPMQLIKKYYGKAIMQTELLNMAINKVLQYIQENQLDIIGHPLLNHENTEHVDNFDDQKNYVYSFNIAFKPQFHINLENLEFQYITFEVNDNLIDEEIQKIASYYATYENFEFFELDKNLNLHGIVSFQNPEPTQNNEHNNSQIPQQNNSKQITHLHHKILNEIPELAQLFVNKKIDETVEIPIELINKYENLTKIIFKQPEPQHDQIKYITFTIKNISLEKPAEITDEFVAKHFEKQNIQTVQELRQNISKKIEKDYNDFSEITFFRDIKKSLIEKVEFELPTEHLKRLIDANLKEQNQSGNIDYNAIIDVYKWDLICSRLLQQFNMEVDEQAIQKYITQLSSENASNEQNDNIVEQYMKYFQDNPKEKEKLIDYLTEQKIKEIIKTNCKIHYKKFESFSQYLKTIK